MTTLLRTSGICLPEIRLVVPFAFLLSVAASITVVVVRPTARAAAGDELLQDLRRGGSVEREVASILAVLEQREGQMNPFWVKYRVDHFLSASNRRELARDSGDRITEVGVDFKDLTYSVEAEIARKGQAVRTSFTGPQLFAGKIVKQASQRIHVFDGTKAVLFNDQYSQGPERRPRYLVSTDPEKASGYMPPIYMTCEPLLCRQLRAWLEKKVDLDVRLAWSDSEGEGRLLALETKAANGAMTKAVLLPDRGFGLRRLDGLGENGIRYLTWKDGRYRSHNGVYYPISGVRTSYDDAGNVYEKYTLEVLSVVTDRDEIPDKLFALEVPQNAELYDLDHKVQVR